MTIAQELHQAIIDARAELHLALHEAHATWDSQPAADAGEEAWSPREAAAHIILADWFFSNAIGRMCGAARLAQPEVDAGTPGRAAASLSRISAADDAVLRLVTDADLEKVYTGQQMGTRSVRQMLERMTTHLEEHVAQIRAVADASVGSRN